MLTIMTLLGSTLKKFNHTEMVLLNELCCLMEFDSRDSVHIQAAMCQAVQFFLKK